MKREEAFQAPARPRVAASGVARRGLFAGAGLAAAGFVAACGRQSAAGYTPAGEVDRQARPRVIGVFDDASLEAGRLLKEAAEIEHDLMVQYLYAGFSLKQHYAPLAGYGAPETTSVLGVAVQEMQHLHAVNDLLSELGFAPVLSRHDFPEEGNIYPFAFKLEPMTRASLAKYVYCEAPPDAVVAKSHAEEAFVRKLSHALGSDPRPNHVGSLYNSIIDIVADIAEGSDLLADPEASWRLDHQRRPRGGCPLYRGMDDWGESAVEEMERLGRMVESFLTLTKLRGGQALAHPEPCNVNELIMDAVESCRTMAKQYDVRLTPELSDRYPQVKVSGECPLLATMIENLLRNAIRFSPTSRSIDIRVSIDDGNCTVTVRDFGPGVPPELLDTLFDRFARSADDGPRRRGHGLGLSIAQGIAELHGGGIKVRNIPEGGCEFTVTLPLLNDQQHRDSV